MNTPATLIDKLSKINEDTTVSVYIPSSFKPLKFKPLNVKQQKNLLRTSLDGVLAGLTLNQALNNICVENVIDAHSLFITDRYPIILALRQHSISDDIKVGEETISTGEQIKKSIQKLKQKEDVKKSVAEFDVGEDLSPEFRIKVTVDLPTIDLDIKYNEHFIKFAKDTDKPGDTVGNLYVYEICKFIVSVTVDGEQFNFKDIAIKDCIKIVESLPLTINSKIVSYIEEVRKLEALFLETDKGTIEIDAAFFTAV